MRVYLDNCCYNRPFDDQGQLRVRLETEAKLKVQSDMREGLVVNAERFIVLNNREPHDYTRWRTTHLHLGDSVHEVAQRARAISSQYEETRQALAN